jgi:hypothetical protein
MSDTSTENIKGESSVEKVISRIKQPCARAHPSKF